MLFIFYFNFFLLNLRKHANLCEKIPFFLLYLTLVTSCITGPFLCCHLLYLIIYLIIIKYLFRTHNSTIKTTIDCSNRSAPPSPKRPLPQPLPPHLSTISTVFNLAIFDKRKLFFLDFQLNCKYSALFLQKLVLI